jgi:hypothetical protein
VTAIVNCIAKRSAIFGRTQNAASILWMKERHDAACAGGDFTKRGAIADRRLFFRPRRAFARNHWRARAVSRSVVHFFLRAKCAAYIVTMKRRI